MQFNAKSAAIAGITAAAPMMMSREVFSKATGTKPKMNILRMWGSMFGLHGPPMYLVGLMTHVVVSASIGLTYAAGFALTGMNRRLPLMGIVAALTHWAVAGLFIGAVPTIDPEVPNEQPAPGFFAIKLGRPDFFAFLLGHLVYGLAVTLLYAGLRPRSQTRQMVANTVANVR